MGWEGREHLFCLSTKIYSLLESISDSDGSDEGGDPFGRKLKPSLVFNVNGADVDVFPEMEVQPAAEGIDFVGVGSVVLRLKAAEAALEFEIGIVVMVVKDVARPEKVRVFSGSREAELVDVALDAQVPAEIKGSIDGEA